MMFCRVRSLRRRRPSTRGFAPEKQSRAEGDTGAPQIRHRFVTLNGRSI
jgi:hypothetical protein